MSKMGTEAAFATAAVASAVAAVVAVGALAREVAGRRRRPQPVVVGLDPEAIGAARMIARRLADDDS